MVSASHVCLNRVPKTICVPFLKRKSRTRYEFVRHFDAYHASPGFAFMERLLLPIDPQTGDITCVDVNDGYSVASSTQWRPSIGIALGDAIAQSTSTAWNSGFDFSRCVKFAIFGFFIHGPLCHYFYKSLDQARFVCFQSNRTTRFRPFIHLFHHSKQHLLSFTYCFSVRRH